MSQRPPGVALLFVLIFFKYLPGISLAFVWNASGICLGSVWVLSGICLGVVWVCLGFVLGLPGVCVRPVDCTEGKLRLVPVWLAFRVCFLGSHFGSCLGFVICLGFVWDLSGCCLGSAWHVRVPGLASACDLPGPLGEAGLRNAEQQATRTCEKEAWLRLPLPLPSRRHTALLVPGKIAS